MNSINDPLFVWRTESPKDPNFPANEKDVPCIYCTSILKDAYYNIGDNHFAGNRSMECPLCGWASFWKWEDDDGETFYSHHHKILKKIHDLNSPELQYDEIGKHLLNNFKNVNRLTPRKFELLVADILKNHGYKVVVTKQTRDGGKDIILFDNNHNQIFVEVKKYSNNIGVKIIRELLGVQLIRNVPYAKLITSSEFTRDARNEARINNEIDNGYTIDLIDATDILRLLEVYQSNKSLVDELKIRSFIK